MIKTSQVVNTTPRISQMAPDVSLEAMKKLDPVKDRDAIRKLAQEINLAVSADVATDALLEQIIKQQEHHVEKYERRQASIRGEEVGDLGAKPNQRITTKGRIVPDKRPDEVEHVAEEDPSKAAAEAEAAKAEDAEKDKKKTSDKKSS